ncbi:MAG: tRNA uridine-5-carboxymethylaminomethyl(34) synthesis GTPase MnmE [Kiritimatiellia bacterium]|jgi:tRNA modification GTPase
MTAGVGEPAIAAVCTAPGRAGIAVIRLSGAEAYAIADRLCDGAKRMPSKLPAGAFRLYKLRDPVDGSFIDEAIVLAFRAPHSYTGEDVVEFQTHGGRVVAQRVLAALVACGARFAGPGEFSRRAFLNGRMDLSRAEAVMDIIGAQSERAERAAAEQLAGRLGEPLDACYDALLSACADVEASLDFADDEMSGILAPADIPGRLQTIAEKLQALADTRREGLLLREGARVVLSGVPNAGKSTLFNALLGFLRAIVSDIPGTTRDTIEETLLLDGIPLRVSDTAGLRETESTIERMGVDRSIALVRGADLNLRLIDLAAAPEPQLGWLGKTDYPPDRTIAVLNKADIAPGGRVETLTRRVGASGYEAVAVSAREKIGLETLREAMTRKLCGDRESASAEQGVAVSERHHALIMEALGEIRAALALDEGGGAEEVAALCAQHLRTAAEAIAQITGRVYSEDLLDRVFSRFCIGK